MPMIVQLAYFSRNTVMADDAVLRLSLEDILARARRNNLRDGITGYLLFNRRWFVQILEGTPEAIASAMQRIEEDPHHTDLTPINQRTIRARSFPEWSMGGAFITSENERIFAKHGFSEDTDPAELTPPGLIALAMDLQDDMRSRRALAKPAGSGLTSHPVRAANPPIADIPGPPSLRRHGSALP